jgi:hypothetical protein
MVPTESPCALLSWLGTSAGVNVILGALMSGALEQWPFWAAHFEAWQKRVLVALMSLVIPVFAVLITIVGCGREASFDTLWSALVAGGMAFASSQGAHTYVLMKNNNNK